MVLVFEICEYIQETFYLLIHLKHIFHFSAAVSSVSLMFWNNMRIVSWLLPMTETVFSLWSKFSFAPCTSSCRKTEGGAGTQWEPAMSIVCCTSVTVYKVASTQLGKQVVTWRDERDKFKSNQKPTSTHTFSKLVTYFPCLRLQAYVTLLQASDSDSNFPSSFLW